MTRAAILIVLLTASASLWADERDATFVSGLRRLQLFDLAERYCRGELASQKNSVEREAELTIELIRTLALHAMSRPSQEREPLWQQARDVAAQFERTRAKHPHVFLIRVQDALTLLARGEVAQQEAEAVGAGKDAMASAAEELRAAAKALEEVNQSLEQEIPQRRRASIREEELSADELTRLQLNVSLHLAKARRLQAMCYEPESRDRKAMLLATLDALEAAVKRLDASDELALRMRVLQMACLRELGQLTDAERVWQLIEQNETPAELRRAGLAEAARLLVTADRPTEAIALLDHPKFAQLTAVSDPEIDLARLEAALAAANTSKAEANGAERAKWQRMAAALAQQIDQQHGRAAGRRADQLVASLLPQDAAGGNVDLLARVADNLYVKRQVDEAIAAYDKAAAAAHTAGDAKREFELRYKSGLVEQQRKNFAAASSRFERTAIELKNHPQAAEAHVLACWNKAQQARSDEAAAAPYVQLLEEHVARWPDSPTVDQAWLWLGQWHQAKEQWSEAFAAYSLVSSESKVFPQALSAAAQCARNELAGATAPAPAAQERAEEVLKYFESVSRDRDADTMQPTPTAQQAALVAAELLMEYVPDGHATAEKGLTDLLSSSSMAPQTWRDEATSLLVAAIAGQEGRRGEAEKLLQSLAQEPAQLLKLLDRLASTSSRAASRTRQDLAALQLDVIQRLAASQAGLTSDQKQQLERLRAESLVQLGRREEALAAYAALAKSLPNNGSVQEAYAELLSQSDDKASREAGLAKWRQIAAKSPPRSERWCKAKYAVASLQLQLGDAGAAATLCRYLLETPPGLAGTGWEERFKKLLRDCEK